MASIFSDIWDGINDFLTGGNSSSRDYEDTVKKAKKDYADEIASINKTYSDEVSAANALRKSAKDLYNEGKETAAATANNKAGIAKRNAKASAMQNSGSKLLAAIQGAQGAVDAGTSGFDESAQYNQALAQQQNTADINARLQAAANKQASSQNAAANQLSATTNAASQIKSSKDSERQSKRNTIGSIASGIMGMFS